MAGKTRFFLSFMLLLAGTGGADSIVVGGKTYTDVKIVESSTRYYFRLPDGSSVSAAKEDIAPDQIRFGEEPLPSAQTPAVMAAASLFAKAPAALPGLSEIAASALRAGAARVTVSSSSDPMETLEVDALVVRNEQTALAFCSVDVAALDQCLLERVLAQLEERGSILRPGGVFLAPTGAHTGRFRGIQKGVWKETLWGVFDEKTIEQAAGYVADAIDQAEKQLQAAQIRIAETEAPEGHAPRQGGSATADSTLSVLSVETASGAPLGYLVNYALCPLPMYGQSPVARRGAPGALALALRAKTGPETPVVFVNGAAGDVEASLAGGEAALGTQLAQAALAALGHESPRDKAALAFAAHSADLPPSLLSGTVPASAVLQSARIDGTIFLALPGLPAAQIGLLLRVKALTQEADHVFLMSQTGEALGFLPGIEEFFAVTEPARASVYGPLMVLWFGEHYLPEAKAAKDAEPVWANVPVLDRFSTAFAAAIERGRRESVLAKQVWQESSQKLESAGAALRALAGELPPEYKALLERVPPEQACAVYVQAVAMRFRSEYAAFSEEQRVMLMGAAHGAGMPFDAVMLLQLFSGKDGLPEPVRKMVESLQPAGYDFLSPKAGAKVK